MGVKQGERDEGQVSGLLFQRVASLRREIWTETQRTGWEPCGYGEEYYTQRRQPWPRLSWE